MGPCRNYDQISLVMRGGLFTARGTYICWDDDEIDYNYYALQDLRRPAYTLSGDRTQKQIDLAGVSV